MSFVRPVLVAACLLALLTASATAARKQVEAAQRLSLESVNDATWRRGNLSAGILLKLQVLLDRAHASPGLIDATRGENLRKAVAAFREMRRLGRGEQVDQKVWRVLSEKDTEPVLVRYTITEKDVAGPFIDAVPEDYREKAALKRLSYTSVKELLAEKFHMSEKLLQQLNPTLLLISPVPRFS
jgi:peptidoglycan hydrolase-like protein with peptidoglycan-binding domain